MGWYVPEAPCITLVTCFVVKDSTVVVHSGGGPVSTEINKAAKILL